MKYLEAYKQLNSSQRLAVDTVDGPVLVIAGPGTGKTQLLGLRVANILQKTDTPPQNILCLTFTENGAANMRDRLNSFIGQAAYDMSISTYHAFGGELIQRFPQYFDNHRSQQAIDDIGKYQILYELVSKLSYQNPLKQTQYHIRDLMSTISDVKRGLLNAKALRVIGENNKKWMKAADSQIDQVFDSSQTLPRTAAKAIPLFVELFKSLELISEDNLGTPTIPSIGSLAKSSLSSALVTAENINKSTPLTKWKNDWLAKDSKDKYILSCHLQNNRLLALADLLNDYQVQLELKGFYDFDDMIIRSINALQQYDEFLFTLQEQYLYILLDEFQDTNAAQLKLVELLTNNPVNEGRPNVLAVGDDDQAIFAFQGANSSNMMAFYNLFNNVKVINLTDNYRSHHDILHTAHNIASQIEGRLHHNFSNINKSLKAANRMLPKSADIARHEFASSIAENSWIAKQITKSIKEGIRPSEIAVLAPKHKYLEPLVSCLNSLGVPVRYEKRENILESFITRQILNMSQLVLYLAENNQSGANSLWPEILSYEFWEFSTTNIWQAGWKANDTKTTWTQALLEITQFKECIEFLLNLAAKSSAESLENMLDWLIGTTKLGDYHSPLRDYYTSTSKRNSEPEQFYDVLSNLTVLRQKLRDQQRSSLSTLSLKDLVRFVELYRTAEQPLLNTSPYAQSEDAVQLMTVFKAKGLEFEQVYLPACLDEVWGDTSRKGSNRLTLPPNLDVIRPAGTTTDERLRILFVAITRAKHSLYLTSSASNYSGKSTKQLKYFNEQTQDDGTVQSLVLPEFAQHIITNDFQPPTEDSLELAWHDRHRPNFKNTRLSALLIERLERYKISPTHLNAFIDTVYGGPESVFFNTILRFPQAPTASGQFGNAIHETMEWTQLKINQSGVMPKTNKIISQFETYMRAKKLPTTETSLLIERGQKALIRYFESQQGGFVAGNIAEQNFANEGVVIDSVHLSGKVDLLRIDKINKRIEVVDFKTGESFNTWKNTPKLHKNKQQLYFYKLLVERSHSYKGYTVDKGTLEFIEPDINGNINRLSLNFDTKELDRTLKLTQVVWRHIRELNFPDISEYSQSLAGIKSFENDLLSGKI